MKALLKRNIKKIQVAKVIVASLLIVMILIDVILVMLEKKDFPTFSWVVRDHRSSLIWLTFLFGGLVAKVFFNRKVQLKESEVSGFLVFSAMVLMLFVLGQLIKVPVETPHQLLILICGGLLAYRAWPQYMQKTDLQER